jgi:hypothetical protein
MSGNRTTNPIADTGSTPFPRTSETPPTTSNPSVGTTPTTPGTYGTTAGNTSPTDKDRPDRSPGSEVH